MNPKNGMPKWLTRQTSVRKNALRLTAQDVLCLVGLTTSQFSFLFSLSPWQVLKITKTYVSFISSAKVIVQEYTIRNDGNILSLVCLWNNGNFSLFSSSLVLSVTSDLIFLCSM